MNITDKYVLSPIDNDTYCRKNGQFFRHLQQHGFSSYKSFFEHYFPDQIKHCECGEICSFIDSQMQYRPTCGSKKCTYAQSSKTKAEYTDSERLKIYNKYKSTMNNKALDDINTINERRKQTNIQKYGVSHPWMNTQIRDKISATMKQKYGATNYSTTLISPESKALLDDKNWMFNQHVTSQIPLWAIGDMLKVGDRTVGIYLHKHGIKTQSYQHSVWENEMAEFLDNQNIIHILNDRTIIAPKEVDFFIPSHNIAIELCGLYWHTERQERITKHYHSDKYLKCSSKNIRLLTIFEDEWIHSKELVKSKILHLLHKSSNKVYGRHVTLTENVPIAERTEFLNRTHIQGSAAGTYTVGLRDSSGTLVGLGLFSKVPKTTSFYLTRFSTSVTIIGGFSKIMKLFGIRFPASDVITFADLRWSIGELYFNNGFELDNKLQPDYAYVKQDKRVHKFNYRRSALARMLPTFDPTLSERDNCFNHGLYRVWDCGKLKFVKKCTHKIPTTVNTSPTDRL